VYEKLTQYCRY